MFSLTALGIGFLVRSSFRLESSSFISSGQEIRISDSDGGYEYSWQLREVIKNNPDPYDDLDDPYDDLDDPRRT